MTKRLDTKRLWKAQYTDGMVASAWVAMAQEMNRSSKSPRVLEQIKKNALASARKIHHGGASNVHQTPTPTPPKSRPLTAKHSRPCPLNCAVDVPCLHPPKYLNQRFDHPGGYRCTRCDTLVIAGVDVPWPCRKTAVRSGKNFRRGREQRCFECEEGL
jgi:hypothetical protein